MGQPNLGVPPQPDPRAVRPEVDPPHGATPQTSRFLLRMAMVFAVLPFGAYGACATKAIDQDPGFHLWCVTVVLALVGAVIGGVSLYRSVRRKEPASKSALFATFVGIFSIPITFFLAISTIHISRGRALRRRGAARLPRLGEGEGWSARTETVALPREAVDGWLANARTEVASVAAFNHLANELLAIGAPADLVRGALVASLEEIEHARLCFAIAGHGDVASFAEATTPPDRAPTPVGVARDCAVEACWLEGASAKVARHLARRDDLPAPIKAALAQIAKEEASHAEHGFEILAHLTARYGDDILVEARRALAEEQNRKVDVPDLDPSLERWGLAGRAVWAAAIREAWFEVDARLAEQASSRSARAA